MLQIHYAHQICQCHSHKKKQFSLVSTLSEKHIIMCPTLRSSPSIAFVVGVGCGYRLSQSWYLTFEERKNLLFLYSFRNRLASLVLLLWADMGCFLVHFELWLTCGCLCAFVIWAWYRSCTCWAEEHRCDQFFSSVGCFRWHEWWLPCVEACPGPWSATKSVCKQVSSPFQCWSKSMYW